MSQMINPIQTHLQSGIEAGRPIIIEPVLQETADRRGWLSTGVFKIYKDAFDDETDLVVQPDEENDNKLLDALNPDYLGKVVFMDNDYVFQGEVLSEAERLELIAIIRDYEEPEV